MTRLKHDNPKAELTALPNCGHFSQKDDPEQVARLIAEFLNSPTRGGINRMHVASA